MKAIELKEGELLMQWNNILISLLVWIPLSLALSIIVLFSIVFPLVHKFWFFEEKSIMSIIIYSFSVLLSFILGFLAVQAFSGPGLTNFKIFYFTNYLLVTNGSEQYKFTFEELDYLALEKNKILIGFIGQVTKDDNWYRYDNFKGYKFRLNPSHEHHAAALVEFLNSKIIRNTTGEII